MQSVGFREALGSLWTWIIGVVLSAVTVLIAFFTFSNGLTRDSTEAVTTAREISKNQASIDSSIAGLNKELTNYASELKTVHSKLQAVGQLSDQISTLNSDLFRVEESVGQLATMNASAVELLETLDKRSQAHGNILGELDKGNEVLTDNLVLALDLLSDTNSSISGMDLKSNLIEVELDTVILQLDSIAAALQSHVHSEGEPIQLVSGGLSFRDYYRFVNGSSKPFLLKLDGSGFLNEDRNYALLEYESGGDWTWSSTDSSGQIVISADGQRGSWDAEVTQAVEKAAMILTSIKSLEE